MAVIKGTTLDLEDKDNPFNEPVLLHLKRIYDGLSNPPVLVPATNHENGPQPSFRSAAFAYIQGEEDIPSAAAKEIKTFPDMLSYISQPEASAMAPLGEQDVSLPLPSYFVNSSHNTYLTGNQLYSHASTSAYEYALLRGCRCLEIDVWDGDATSSSSTSSSSLDDSSSTGDPSRKSTTSSTKTKRGYVRGTASKAFHKLGRVGTRMKDIMVAEVPPDGETEDDDTAGGRVSPSVAKTEEKKKKKKKHGASAFSRLNPLHSRAGTEDDESQSRASATVPTQSLPIRPTVPTPTTISTAPQPAPGPAPAPAPAHASTSNPPQPQAALGVSESTTIVKPTATIQRPVPNDPHQPTWALDETSSPQEMRAPLEVEAIEPVVLHGHTLTSSVTFRSVCETIHKTAFIASTLPLIVSLEVHASHQQQQVMVDIMKEVWGESLLADAPEEVRGRMKGEVGDVGVRDVLPSPKQLRGKILVKVKPGAPREVMEEIAEEAREAGKELDILVSNDPEENTTTMRKASSAPAAGGAELAPTRSIDTESAKDKQKAAKILPSLGELGIYTAGYSFKNLFVPEANIPHHMFSLSEAAVKEAHKSHRLELFEHNRNYMMRSYPSGMRIGSSNPDPAFCWRQGIQFAALNWQKKDKGMMLNIGMFAGTEGYVLKPEEYRGDEWRRRVASGKHQDTNGNPDGPNTVVSNTGISKRHTVTLAIEVFAGQNIPPPPGDSANSTFNPYIVCKLNAACADDSAKAVSEAKIGPADIAKVSLKTPSKVGMDPDFEGKRLAFPTCHNVLQELSFLRIKVYDHDYMRNDLSSWACIRLDRLRPGYRFIRLYDPHGKVMPSSLFVRIHKSVSI